MIKFVYDYILYHTVYIFHWKILKSGLWIRIRISGENWIRIQIRIRVKSWVRSEIMFKFRTFRAQIQPWRDVNTHNGGMEAQNGALHGV